MGYLNRKPEQLASDQCRQGTITHDGYYCEHYEKWFPLSSSLATILTWHREHRHNSN